MEAENVLVANNSSVPESTNNADFNNRKGKKRKEKARKHKNRIEKKKKKHGTKKEKLSDTKNENSSDKLKQSSLQPTDDSNVKKDKASGVDVPLAAKENAELLQNNTSKGKNNPEEEKKSGETCAICMELLNGGSGGPKAWLSCCAHQFHTSCITSWAAQRNSCPLCQKHFDRITNEKGNVPFTFVPEREPSEEQFMSENDSRSSSSEERSSDLSESEKIGRRMRSKPTFRAFIDDKAEVMDNYDSNEEYDADNLDHVEAYERDVLHIDRNNIEKYFEEHQNDDDNETSSVIENDCYEIDDFVVSDNDMNDSSDAEHSSKKKTFAKRQNRRKVLDDDDSDSISKNVDDAPKRKPKVIVSDDELENESESIKRIKKLLSSLDGDKNGETNCSVKTNAQDNGLTSNDANKADDKRTNENDEQKSIFPSSNSPSSLSEKESPSKRKKSILKENKRKFEIKQKKQCAGVDEATSKLECLTKVDNCEQCHDELGTESKKINDVCKNGSLEEMKDDSYKKDENVVNSLEAKASNTRYVKKLETSSSALDGHDVTKKKDSKKTGNKGEFEQTKSSASENLEKVDNSISSLEKKKSKHSKHNVKKDASGVDASSNDDYEISVSNDKVDGTKEENISSLNLTKKRASKDKSEKKHNGQIKRLSRRTSGTKNEKSNESDNATIEQRDSNSDELIEESHSESSKINDDTLTEKKENVNKSENITTENGKNQRKPYQLRGRVSNVELVELVSVKKSQVTSIAQGTGLKHRKGLVDDECADCDVQKNNIEIVITSESEQDDVDMKKHSKRKSKKIGKGKKVVNDENEDSSDSIKQKVSSKKSSQKSKNVKKNSSSSSNTELNGSNVKNELVETHVLPNGKNDQKSGCSEFALDSDKRNGKNEEAGVSSDDCTSEHKSKHKHHKHKHHKHHRHHHRESDGTDANENDVSKKSKKHKKRARENDGKKEANNDSSVSDSEKSSKRVRHEPSLENKKQKHRKKHKNDSKDDTSDSHKVVSKSVNKHHSKEKKHSNKTEESERVAKKRKRKSRHVNADDDAIVGLKSGNPANLVDGKHGNAVPVVEVKSGSQGALKQNAITNDFVEEKSEYSASAQVERLTKGRERVLPSVKVVDSPKNEEIACSQNSNRRQNDESETEMRPAKKSRNSVLERLQQKRSEQLASLQKSLGSGSQVSVETSSEFPGWVIYQSPFGTSATTRDDAAKVLASRTVSAVKNALGSLTDEERSMLATTSDDVEKILSHPHAMDQSKKETEVVLMNNHGYLLPKGWNFALVNDCGVVVKNTELFRIHEPDKK